MTPPRIVIRPSAARDVDDQAELLAQINEQLAQRYLEAVDKAIQGAARLPGMGSPAQLANPRLQNLRSCLVGRKFRKHIVFYLPRDDGIEVVRVLYGPRDVQSILEAET